MKALSRIFPLAGVTTNPALSPRVKNRWMLCIRNFMKQWAGQASVVCPGTATTAEGMVNDARKLRSITADIVVKIPVTTEGLAASKILKAEGIPTLGTAVYGAAQGLLSALAGAEYVAPYVNRIDAQGGSGIQTVTDLHQLLNACAAGESAGSELQNPASGAGLLNWQDVNQLRCHWM
ncbi:transaldolase family protein [Escherichia coli]